VTRRPTQPEQGCRQGKTAPPEPLAARLAAREAERADLHSRMASQLRREAAER
jgi:hypothetical protein